MTDQRLSVAERNTVCVGSVAFLTGEIEYSLDKTPDLHGNGAEAAGQKRDQKLNERALCEAEIEVVHAETAEEYAEKTCGKLGFTRSILGGGLGLGLRLSLLSFGILSAFACNGSADGKQDPISRRRSRHRSRSREERPRTPSGALPGSPSPTATNV